VVSEEGAEESESEVIEESETEDQTQSDDKLIETTTEPSEKEIKNDLKKDTRE
jgi:hypothetical protein